MLSSTPLRHQAPPRLAGLFTVAIAAAIALMQPAFAHAGATGEAWETQTERALTRGDLFEAESLLTVAPASTHPHSLHLLKARLAASRGDWRRTDNVLRQWNAHPDRPGNTGEVLFWMGWSALHQGETERADSLFVLASAYAGDPRAQDALEYRFAALLEHPPLLQEYLRGLPESPLPGHLRAASLERIPPESRLHPYAMWHLALIHESTGDAGRAREILEELSRNTGTLTGRRAAAKLGALHETAAPDTAQMIYENFLLKHQHGVPAEFSRERLQNLRKQPENP